MGLVLTLQSVLTLLSMLAIAPWSYLSAFWVCSDAG
jgi:hypothetical protein